MSLTLEPYDGRALVMGNVVLARLQRPDFSYLLLHQVLQCEADRFLIGDNAGGVDGWITTSDILGYVTTVEAIDPAQSGLHNPILRTTPRPTMAPSPEALSDPAWPPSPVGDYVQPIAPEVKSPWKNALHWMFTSDDGTRSVWSIIRWWELRRIPYNIIVIGV